MPPAVSRASPATFAPPSIDVAVSTPGRSALKRAAAPAAPFRRWDAFATSASREDRQAMSEVRTPAEDTIESDLSRIADAEVPAEDGYDGPDPEDDPKGDASDEDQGT